MKHVKKAASLVGAFALAICLLVPMNVQAAAQAVHPTRYITCNNCKTITPFDYCGFCAPTGYPYHCRICRYMEGSPNWYCNL